MYDSDDAKFPSCHLLFEHFLNSLAASLIQSVSNDDKSLDDQFLSLAAAWSLDLF